MKKTKRKSRTTDSDSEFERDHRKRHTDHTTKPGTSRAAQEADTMKELFGDFSTKVVYRNIVEQLLVDWR